MTQGAIYRYPTSALAADYARACVGLIMTAGPLIALPLTSAMALVLLAAAGLFAAFGLLTLARQRLRLRACRDGIERLGTSRPLAWTDLEVLDLAYYSTRRDGRGGWMQLTLSDGSQRIRVDSRLDGFRDLARRAAAAARANQLCLEPACAANIAAIGADPAGAAARTAHG